MEKLATVILFCCMVPTLLAGPIRQPGSAVQSLTPSSTNASVTPPELAKKRRKRWDYEDKYEWENDDDLTYDEYYQEEEEPSFMEKVALKWRTAGPRLVMLGAPITMILLFYLALGRLACRAYCMAMKDQCACCGNQECRRICMSCYTDPNYERVKQIGELMGIEITYATYEKICDHYTRDAQTF